MAELRQWLRDFGQPEAPVVVLQCPTASVAAAIAMPGGSGVEALCENQWRISSTKGLADPGRWQILLANRVVKLVSILLCGESHTFETFNVLQSSLMSFMIVLNLILIINVFNIRRFTEVFPEYWKSDSWRSSTAVPYR